jgi:DNA-binding transcriptional ArsR family regulator
MDISFILKTIGEKNRLRILCLLFKKQRVCVSDIAKSLSLSVAVTSHHLKQLEKTGLLEASKSGKEVCYLLSKQPILSDIKKIICKYPTP